MRMGCGFAPDDWSAALANADDRTSGSVQHRSCIQFQPVERELVDWLIRYGAPLLFFAQVFGIFGLPIPDEFLLTVAGALVRKGTLRGTSIAIAAIAGCLSGISLSYVVGRLVDVKVLHRRFRRHQAAIERAQAWFRRFDSWLLAFGYFIPGVRHVTAILAGSSSLEYREFALYAYSGGVLWCAVFLLLGYYAGDHWQEVVDKVRSNVAFDAAVLAGAIALYVLVRFAAERRRLIP
jgi:membrane protein DedA with SNARE-associated domain